jgi:hypothetical protein
MAMYDDLFGRFDIPIAQILLTRDTLAEVIIFILFVITLLIHSTVLTFMIYF